MSSQPHALLKDESWIRTGTSSDALWEQIKRDMEEAMERRMIANINRRAARCARERALRDAGVPFDREEWAR